MSDTTPYRDEVTALRAENAALRDEIARLHGEQRVSRAATARFVLGWAIVGVLDLAGGIAFPALINSPRDAGAAGAAAVVLAMVVATGWQLTRTLRGVRWPSARFDIDKE